MAERRAAGFNIPLSFYDGAEVQSIPKRIRAGAVGVWSLAGNYAATQLTDGYVGAEQLKLFGCTPAIRIALASTINKKGDPSPLWVDAWNGGVQLTNWPKHQRTNEEVSTYRAAEAERKRLARASKVRAGTSVTTPKVRDSTNEVGQNVAFDNESTVYPDDASTSDDTETSGRTQVGRPHNVRSTKTETKTETELSTYVATEATDPYAPGISATPGADLVRAVVPKGHPSATLTSLRIQASELIHQGAETDVVRAALQLWCDKPGVGIGRTILSSLYSEAIKARAAPRPNGHNGSGLTAGESKVAGWAALGQPQPPHLKAINE